MVIDGCRIAENSYYIKHREDGFTEKTYKQIAQEMLNLGDAFIMSAKRRHGKYRWPAYLKDEALSVKCKTCSLYRKVLQLMVAYREGTWKPLLLG